MNIYYLIFSVLSIISILEVFFRNKSLYLRYSILLFLIIFVGIRFNVGNDYEGYLRLYYEIKNGYTPYFEPLFQQLNIISCCPEMMFFLMSLLTFLFLHKGIEYFNSKNYIFSLTIYFGLYFLLFNIHIIRQGLAIAIVLYAYKYILEKKYKKFIVFIVIAMGFHKSAIIAFPIAYIALKNFTIRTYLILFLSSVIIFILLKYYNSVLFNILSEINIFKRYSEVYNNKEHGSSYGISLGIVFDLVIMIVYLLRNNLNSRKEKFIFNIFFLSILMSFILNSASIFLRGNYYFRIMNIFLIANLIDFIKPKIIVFISLLIFALLYLYMNLNTGLAKVTYHTIFY